MKKLCPIKSRNHAADAFKLNADASAVAARRLLSLSYKSPAEAQRLWMAWGAEKIVAAQQAAFAGTMVWWKLAAMPLSLASPLAFERVATASLAPIRRKVSANRRHRR